MPSAEVKDHVRQIAISMVFLQASSKPDALHKLAEKYVNRLNDEELIELTGIDCR
jgi:hypothetical protein